MFGIFKKKPTEIKSPLSGRIIPIENVPDEVFAQKMVGDGIGIEANEGIVVSPADGEILQVFPTKHAVALRTPEGVEILIHIGLDTVNMKGEGFEAFVKQGDQVKAGQELVRFDINLVREKAKSIITPVIITNYKDMGSIEKLSGMVSKGSDTIMRVTKK